MVRTPFAGEHLKLEPFWSWRAWNIQKNQILANIMMFLPVGILAGKLWKWESLLIAAGFSAAVEVLQLVTARGLCEFDDVIHNMIGALIGAVLVVAVFKVKGEEEHR